MGSRLGVLKIAAKRVGLSVEEYQRRRSAGLKRCSDCKQWKARAQFYKNRTQGDGLSGVCIDCITQHFTKKGVSLRERREKRKEGLYWCSRCLNWVSHEKMVFCSNGHSTGLCRKHFNESQREQYASNPERRRKAYLAAKKRRDQDRTLPLREKRRLLDIFDNKCAYCRKRPAEVWDHVVPLAAGGRSQVGNIVPACRRCNTSKLDRDLLEWVESKGVVLSNVFWSVVETPEETIDYTPYRNRMVTFRGADNKAAAFTNEEVREIRELYASGKLTLAQLAEKRGVHKATIKRAVRGQTYKAAGGPIKRREQQTSWRGAYNTSAAFTWEEAQNIRAKYATGRYTYSELAAMYRVHQATIGRIVKGETYKDGQENQNRIL